MRGGTSFRPPFPPVPEPCSFRFLAILGMTPSQSSCLWKPEATFKELFYRMLGVGFIGAGEA